jgi:hypothetical protein
MNSTLMRGIGSVIIGFVLIAVGFYLVSAKGKSSPTEIAFRPAFILLETNRLSHRNIV